LSRAYLYSLGTRAWSTILNFVQALLIARVLGSQGKGETAFIITTISFVLFFCNIFSGPSLVYILPRKHRADQYSIAFLWIICIVAIEFVFLRLVYPFAASYCMHLCILTFLQAIIALNQASLLAAKRVQRFNISMLSQLAAQLITFLFLFYILDKRNQGSIFVAIYAASIFTLVLSTLFNWGDLRRLSYRISKDTIYALLVNGIQYQAFEFLQFISLRFGFFFLMRFEGKTSLGIYSIAVSVLEVVWLFPRSLGIIQYSNIANSNDNQYQAAITLNLLKLLLPLAGITLMLITFIPTSWYVFVFGPGFVVLKMYMRWLIPGTFMYTIFIVLSNYFAGKGLNYYNILSALIGAVITIVLGYTLIGTYEMSGTALTASMAFTISALVLALIFHKMNNFKPSDYIIKGDDVKLLKSALTSALAKRKL
jgi:O-antigen/teichoic acid export membrane protein